MAAPSRWDVAIVGGGAAGLATAIFTRERDPGCSVIVLDGARRVGAKILVSGGARCNVTNTVVSERDYWGGPSTVIRRVLRALPVATTIEFFQRSGVSLHEEEDGKLFPDSNRARDVLAALLGRADAAGVVLRESRRVSGIEKGGEVFTVVTAEESFAASRVVLATGGQSLPKSGSDGRGYAFAEALGHTIVPRTPALAPIVLGASAPLHAALSGVSLEAELALWIDGAVSIRLSGALLWTHFGISGPVALNMSRHWARARLDRDRRVELTASFAPGRDFTALESFWLEEADARPRSTVASALTRLLPTSMASALLASLDVDATTPLAHLARDDRRRLTRALTAWPLAVHETRGYNYAEATAGGVDLREIDPATMRSRRCPGLYLVGEVLDVDGRLGGFNFQWAWASAFVAASSLAPRVNAAPGR